MPPLRVLGIVEATNYGDQDLGQMVMLFSVFQFSIYGVALIISMNGDFANFSTDILSD